MPRIRIDRLNLRLRGAVSEDVHDLASAVGEQVLRHLYRNLSRGTGKRQSLEAVAVAPVKLPAAATAGHARQEIAVHVARSVAAEVSRASENR